MPVGTDTPLHLFLMLDLADVSCPIRSDGSVRYLPLYYPLKYGLGGPVVQYDVVSNTEIKLIFISDERPDAVAEQYVQVAELPLSPAEILPLSYEEARILAFLDCGGYFQPNEEDRALLAALNRDHPMIAIGGGRRLPVNAGDVICRNSECRFFNQRIRLEVIAAVPPVPVNGTDDFWHEFQGGHFDFYFGLCQHCRTVIAFNVAS